MMMKDFAEKGYKVVVSSMFGDVEYSLVDFEKGLEQDEEVFLIKKVLIMILMHGVENGKIFKIKA